MVSGPGNYSSCGDLFAAHPVPRAGCARADQLPEDNAFARELAIAELYSAIKLSGGRKLRRHTGPYMEFFESAWTSATDYDSEKRESQFDTE